MEKEEEYIWGEECFCEGKIELSGLEVHKAIVSRDYQRLEELIKARTSLEVKNNFGLTPLHVAVHRRDFKAAEALIKGGCDVNARSSAPGKSALSIAAFSGDVAIFELLLNHGASVKVCDDYGSCILHDAVLGAGDNPEIVEIIVKSPQGQKLLTTRNRSGRSPLHEAAFLAAKKQVVEALLKAADLQQQPQHKNFLNDGLDKNGRSVADLADTHSGDDVDWRAIIAEHSKKK